MEKYSVAKHLLAALVVFNCAAWSGRAAGEDTAVLTFADLRKQGIVEFLGKEILLKAAFLWEYSTVKIPEDPTPQEVLRRRAGPLRVSFDTPEFEDVSGSKVLHCRGDLIKKTTDTQGRQQYAAGNLALVNARQEYVLRAVLSLRPHLKPEYLKNPAFVKQSNNPRYWTQTFEVLILGVNEAED